METGYTPAPWIVELSPISGPARVIAPNGCGTGCPCEIVGEAMPEDARLIAAAPDLVEALVNILAWADPYALPDCDNNARNVIAAKAALAKAGVL